jgi:hypothetical protein
MRRQVCWVEKMEDGVKREIRVAIEQGKVKWQFKRADEEKWDYDSAPTAEQWAELAEKMERRYCRRNVPLKDLEIIRKLKPR